MLQQADAGLLFNPPASVVDEFPQFPVARSYKNFKITFEKARQKLESL